MSVADDAALGMIAEDVLAPEIVERAIEELMRMIDQPVSSPDTRRATLSESLRKVTKELGHLQAAVAEGEPLATLVDGIRDRERRQKELQALLRALDAEPALLAATPQLRCEATALLADWRGLLGKHVATSRQLLRKLLDRERFVFYPQRDRRGPVVRGRG